MKLLQIPAYRTVQSGGHLPLDIRLYSLLSKLGDCEFMDHKREAQGGEDLLVDLRRQARQTKPF
jgi:hypothetical protein